MNPCRHLPFSNWLTLGLAGLVLAGGSGSLFGGELVQAWAQRHGTPMQPDFVTSINTGLADEIFVTGGGATIVYSPAGVPVRTNLHSGGTHKIDASGNLFVAGGFYTTKFSNQGVPLWTNRFDTSGAKNAYRIIGLAADASGGVATLGADGGSGDFNGVYVTIKYSSDGEALWTNRHHMGEALVAPKAICTDSNGNVFVTGTATTGVEDYVATAAYSPTGDLLWESYYDGPYVGPYYDADVGRGIAVDSSGDIVVGGESGLRMVVVKYSNGAQVWERKAPAGKFAALVIGADDNIYVAGQAASDFLTVKYAPNGTAIWTNRLALGHDNRPADMAVDRNGNVFVTGISQVYATNQWQIATVGYSANGALLFTRRYPAPLGGAVAAGRVEVDAKGNVIVGGGVSDVSNTDYDVLTIKYAPTIPVAIERGNNQVILSWSSATGTLQATPALNEAFINIPGATSPYTNSISGAQQFFRVVEN